MVLHENLPDPDICKVSNTSYSASLIKSFRLNPVLANVAIASAITAYARIHMIQFKTIPGNPPLYTDTDSVFLPQPLDSSLVDSSLLGYI
jgi:hypothetical protein